MKSDNIIVVKNLSYKKIFSNLSLEVKKGSFISVSGPNNCGKSTLIKILSGLISTENMVFFGNASIESINKTKLFYDEGIVLLNDKISFLFDTVKDEIMFVLDNINIDSDKKQERYNEVLKLLDLGKYEKSNPNLLNKNEKIFVLLALAIIHKPKILYLDNVDSMMGKADRRKLMDVLSYLNKEEKMTIVMSTTCLEETLVSDYLYILSGSNIALEGRPLDILKDDNIINKRGLSRPFMVDLSVKLRDYDLVSDICLDMEGMVDILWK